MALIVLTASFTMPHMIMRQFTHAYRAPPIQKALFNLVIIERMTSFDVRVRNAELKSITTLSFLIKNLFYDFLNGNFLFMVFQKSKANRFFVFNLSQQKRRSTNLTCKQNDATRKSDSTFGRSTGANLIIEKWQ